MKVSSMIEFSPDTPLELQARLTDILPVSESETVVVEYFARRSQYDVLLELSPLPRGRILMLAIDGDGFHGQHGRPWQSGRGNLYLCMKLEARCALPTDTWPKLLDVAPTAIVKTITPHIVCPCTRKPVNDIMIQGKKTAGTLTHCRQEKTRFCAFFGIGLNVRFAPECDQPTTCLAHHCPEHVQVEDLWFTVLRELILHLTDTFEDFVSQNKASLQPHPPFNA